MLVTVITYKENISAEMHSWFGEVKLQSKPVFFEKSNFIMEHAEGNSVYCSD